MQDNNLQQNQVVNLKKLKAFEKPLTKIKDVYQKIGNLETDPRVKKYEQLVWRYQNIFSGEDPEYFVRAPGIVNLMGDDCLSGSEYGSVNFPIEQDIVILVGKNKKKEIQLEHTQQTSYPTQTFSIDYMQAFKDIQQQEDNDNNEKDSQIILKKGKADKPTQAFNWFMIGYKAALTGVDTNSLSGLNVLIDFNFQGNSSLSFTNAYTTAVALASLAINKHVKPNIEILMYNLQKFKKIVSKDESLDIDGNKQLMCLLNQANTLQYKDLSLNEEENKNNQYKQVFLEFPQIDHSRPLNNYVFILADSLTEKTQVMSLGQRREKRMCEIRVGLQLLLRGMEVEKDREQFKNIKQVAEFLSFTPQDMVECVKEHIQDKEYTIQELEELTKIPLIQLCQDIPFMEQVIQPLTTFSPYKRILHYLEEEIRVQNIKDLLQENQKSQQEAKEGQKYENNVKVWENIATQMEQSYQSQKNNLECLSENIENVRSEMVKQGCLGCKLIGQGWDGILIGLVQEHKADEVIEKLQIYYSNPENNISISDDLDYLLYKSISGTGAKVLDPQFELWFA